MVVETSQAMVLRMQRRAGSQYPLSVHSASDLPSIRSHFPMVSHTEHQPTAHKPLGNTDEPITTPNRTSSPLAVTAHPSTPRTWPDQSTFLWLCLFRDFVKMRLAPHKLDFVWKLDILTFITTSCFSWLNNMPSNRRTTFIHRSPSDEC